MKKIFGYLLVCACLLSPTLVSAQEASIKISDIFFDYTTDTPGELIFTNQELQDNLEDTIFLLETHLIIEGFAKDLEGISSFVLNDEAIKIADDGTFKTEFPLIIGINALEFTLTDKFGHKTRRSFKLERVLN